jgi:hypothetical protein
MFPFCRQSYSRNGLGVALLFQTTIYWVDDITIPQYLVLNFHRITNYNIKLLFRHFNLKNLNQTRPKMASCIMDFGESRSLHPPSTGSGHSFDKPFVPPRRERAAAEGMPHSTRYSGVIKNAKVQ